MSQKSHKKKRKRKKKKKIKIIYLKTPTIKNKSATLKKSGFLDGNNPGTSRRKNYENTTEKKLLFTLCF
jgi:hypothetical protein